MSRTVRVNEVLMRMLAEQDAETALFKVVVGSKWDRYKILNDNLLHLKKTYSRELGNSVCASDSIVCQVETIQRDMNTIEDEIHELERAYYEA